MTYQVAICDDEPAAASCIAEIVRQWAAGSGNPAEIRVFPSAEAFLFLYAEDKYFDILLLDIEMSGMNGVELARRVRQENKEIQIIFITGYTDYISDGYEVEALHYLIKPVDAEKLIVVLDRAAEKLKKNERALLIEIRGELIRLPFYEISYLEVRQNYVTIHAKEEYTVKKTLSELEKELDGGFFRAGRSYLVNLGFIRRISKTEVILKNGESFQLPRGMYEPLNRAMIRYF